MINHQEIFKQIFTYRDNPNLNISDTSNFQIESSHLSYTLNHSSHTIQNFDDFSRNCTKDNFSISKNSKNSNLSKTSNNFTNDEQEKASYSSLQNKKLNSKDSPKNKDTDKSSNQFFLNFSDCNSNSNLQISSNSIVFTKNLDNNNNADSKEIISTNALSPSICNYYYDITPYKNNNNNTNNHQQTDPTKPKLKQINLSNITNRNQPPSIPSELTSRSEENNYSLASGEAPNSVRRRICLEKKTPIKYNRLQLKSGEKKVLTNEGIMVSNKNLSSNNLQTNNSSTNYNTNTVNDESSKLLHKNINNINICGITGRKNLMDTFEKLSKEQKTNIINKGKDESLSSHNNENDSIVINKDLTHKNDEEENEYLLKLKRKNDNFSFAINYNNLQKGTNKMIMNKNATIENTSRGYKGSKKYVNSILNGKLIDKASPKSNSNFAFINKRPNSQKSKTEKKNILTYNFEDELKTTNNNNIMNKNKNNNYNTICTTTNNIHCHVNNNTSRTGSNVSKLLEIAENLNKTKTNKQYRSAKNSILYSPNDLVIGKSLSESKKKVEKTDKKNYIPVKSNTTNKKQISDYSGKHLSVNLFNNEANNIIKISNKEEIIPSFKSNSSKKLQLLNEELMNKPSIKNPLSERNKSYFTKEKKNPKAVNTTSSSKGSKNNSNSSRNKHQSNPIVKIDLNENNDLIQKNIINNMNNNHSINPQPKISHNNEKDSVNKQPKVINNFSNYRKKKQSKIENKTSNSNSNQTQATKHQAQIIFYKLDELPGDADSQLA